MTDDKPLTDEEIAAIEAAVQAMTPGPLKIAPIAGTEDHDTAVWYAAKAIRAGVGPLHVAYVDFTEPGSDDDHLIVALTGNGPTSEANARGIVALRNAAPRLLTDLRAALAEAGRLRAVVEAVGPLLIEWDAAGEVQHERLPFEPGVEAQQRARRAEAALLKYVRANYAAIAPAPEAP